MEMSWGEWWGRCCGEELGEDVEMEVLAKDVLRRARGCVVGSGGGGGDAVFVECGVCVCVGVPGDVYVRVMLYWWVWGVWGCAFVCV